MSRALKAGLAHAGWRGLMLPLLLLLAWEWASRQGTASAYVFVPLPKIAGAFLTLLKSGELWANLKVSLVRTCEGLGIGISIGILLGTLMALSRLVDRLIGPLYHALRQVPLLGLVPLIALWFGGDESSKLIVVSLAAFYPTLLSAYDGIRQTDHRYLEVGRLTRLKPHTVFFQILLPSAAPSIFTGIAQALAFAWLASMGAELLFTLGPGIGALLLNAETAGSMETALICVLTIAIIGYAMNSAFRLWARKLTPWTASR